MLLKVPAYVDGAEPVQHVTVVKNKAVVLRCAAHGIPPPTVTWLKDGRAIRPDDRVRLLMSGRHLELSSVDETDAAWYTCTADNVAGSGKIDFNLTVVGTDLRHVYFLFIAIMIIC